ncbi:MAG TPA: cupin domain-containing protein [Stellaceae bacterium]
MRTHVKLVVAMLCGVGLGIAGTQALQAQQEVKRNVLQHADLTGSTTTEVYMTLIEAPAGSGFAPHIHHGDEFTYVMEGALDLDVAGQGTKSVKAGDTIHVNRETVHGGKVVSATPAKLLAVHIVDKGKPLADPVK